MANIDSHGDLIGRSSAVLAVTIAMISLSTLFVSLRMVSRAAIVKSVCADDWIMLVALIFALGLSFTTCYDTAWGLGRHEASVPLSWQGPLRRAEYAISVLYQPALMATKTSILIFYIRLSKADRVFRRACYGTLAVVNAGGLALTFVTIFQCRPVHAFFDLTLPAGAKCTDILAIYLASVPLNLITDVAILFLPMPILTRMRLPRKQKIILIITFSFGVFVAAVDVIRISYLQSASETRLAEIQSAEASGSLRSAEDVDSSWYLSLSYMWSAVEVNVGIMCACVPGLKPLVARFMPSLLRNVDDPTSNSKPGSLDYAGLDVQSIPSAQSPPPPVHHRSMSSQDAGADDPEMGMMDFLTTPDMTQLPSHALERSQTAQTNTTRHTSPQGPTFFDFVDMQQRKSLVHLTNRQSIFPIGVVTVLFFIWGFEYGLLAELNQEFQSVAKVTPGQSTGIHSAYFVGYFLGPILVGWPVLRHWGFRSCFPVGLCIYAGGLLIFWPAAVLTSWPTFIVTNFIVGFGLSILEVAANPWIFLCGPPEYGEIRLNLSQGVQAIGGSVVAPLIATKSFFGKNGDAPSLVNTQWAYLGISLATALLAIAYYYIPLPEATNAELDDVAERLDDANDATIGNVRIITLVLAVGVFSQFCYVGAQEVNATQWAAYLDAVAPHYDEADYMAVAHTAFAASRFLAAVLGFLLPPRVLLLAFYLGAIVFEALARHTTGGTAVAMIVLAFFMEGPLFALIFGQALRGQGRASKRASVALTAAISGGAVFAPISSHLSNATARPAPYSLYVAVAAFAAGAVFPLGLNAWAPVRCIVDPVPRAAAAASLTTPPSSTSSGARAGGRALSYFSIGKKLHHLRRASSNAVEHRERRSPTALHPP